MHQAINSEYPHLHDKAGAGMNYKLLTRKNGERACIKNINKRIWREATPIVADVYAEFGFTTLPISCGLDGEHMVGSFHPLGKALDVSTEGMDPSREKAMYHQIKALLNPIDFDVVLHIGSHIHYEDDPH